MINRHCFPALSNIFVINPELLNIPIIPFPNQKSLQPAHNILRNTLRLHQIRWVTLRVPIPQPTLKITIELIIWNVTFHRQWFSDSIYNKLDRVLGLGGVCLDLGPTIVLLVIRGRRRSFATLLRGFLRAGTATWTGAALITRRRFRLMFNLPESLDLLSLLFLGIFITPVQMRVHIWILGDQKLLNMVSLVHLRPHLHQLLIIMTTLLSLIAVMVLPTSISPTINRWFLDCGSLI